MYIILALFLLMGLNGSRADPLESIEHLKPNNVIEDTKNRFLWTVHQLERCYLWSRTLPYEERLDYLITLQRKISDARDQRNELFDSYLQQLPFETKILHRATAKQLRIRLEIVFYFVKPIFIGCVVFFVCLTMCNNQLVYIIA